MPLQAVVPQTAADPHSNNSAPIADLDDTGTRIARPLTVAVGVVLPDGMGGVSACPELLTAKEAVRYLRLDEMGVEKGLRALRYYCGRGLIHGTQVGRWKRYRRVELDLFLERQTDAD